MSQLASLPHEVFDSWAEVYDASRTLCFRWSSGSSVLCWRMFAGWTSSMPAAVQGRWLQRLAASGSEKLARGRYLPGDAALAADKLDHTVIFAWGAALRCQFRDAVCRYGVVFFCRQLP